MKHKKTLLVLFGILFPLFQFTLQAQWDVQLDNQNFTSLERIHFIDENYGWAIGDPYFYTTDGGQNWYLDPNWWPEEHWGKDIVFVNHDTGFIAARHGIIHKTVDGGNNWTVIQTPATQDIMRLFFVDENNGWATLDNFIDSSQVIYTIDGGDNWFTQRVFAINLSYIRPIYFINDSVGYGAGGYYDVVNDDSYSSIVKTQNKGETWKISYLSQNSFYTIGDIYFRDTLMGWAVGEKTSSNVYLILKTGDGGKTWTEQTIENTHEPGSVNCVYFVNDTTGWIGVGKQLLTDPYGAIYFTDDGGENWQLQQEFHKAVLDIQMLNCDTGWAVGADYIYCTTNGDTIIINGINESSKGTDFFTVTPNPTNGVFKIKTNHQLSIINYQLTDITGKVVYKAHLRVRSIDISNQPKGIYFLTIQYRINNHINSLTKKIIKL